MEQTYCIKTMVSDLELLVLNITVLKIESNMVEICNYISKNLNLGMHRYKFKNSYNEMTQTHYIRCYIRFENKLTENDEKFIKNLRISEFGKLEA